MYAHSLYFKYLFTVYFTVHLRNFPILQLSCYFITNLKHISRKIYYWVFFSNRLQVNLNELISKSETY